MLCQRQPVDKWGDVQGAHVQGAQRFVGRQPSKIRQNKTMSAIFKHIFNHRSDVNDYDFANGNMWLDANLCRMHDDLYQ
jgi:hypothetical protein